MNGKMIEREDGNSTGTWYALPGYCSAARRRGPFNPQGGYRNSIDKEPRLTASLNIVRWSRGQFQNAPDDSCPRPRPRSRFGRALGDKSRVSCHVSGMALIPLFLSVAAYLVIDADARMCALVAYLAILVWNRR